jgi:hypothetical protein
VDGEAPAAVAILLTFCKRRSLPTALQNDPVLSDAVLADIEIGVLAELEDAERIVVAALRGRSGVAFALLVHEAVIAGALLAERRGVVDALLLDRREVLFLLGPLVLLRQAVDAQARTRSEMQGQVLHSAMVARGVVT